MEALRKTGIFIASAMPALTLLSAPSEPARAMDSRAPAVNLRASVTEDRRIEVTWDFPSYPYKVQVFGVREQAGMYASDYSDEATAGTSEFTFATVKPGILPDFMPPAIRK